MSQAIKLGSADNNGPAVSARIPIVQMEHFCFSFNEGDVR